MERSSGVLLHISSLPSRFGIGDLGSTAYDFVDFCVETHQSYWQILPLTPIDKMSGYSPYSSISTFAYNPLFISPEKLLEEQLLFHEDIEDILNDDIEKINFDKVVPYKMNMLKKAYHNYLKNKSCEGCFIKFMEEHKQWLDDFAIFVVIKNQRSGKSWVEWEEGLRSRDEQSLKIFIETYEEDIEEIKFQQFLFFKQWESLKKYCVEKGIKIIGDVPIYVNWDSVDVWKNPELFKMDQNFQLSVVSGVPPDYFSLTGQRWGNPVYDWDVLKETKYAWWVQRILHNLEICDVVRIDHFRGLVNYWEIQAEEKTAINGEWKDVPHEDFFKTLNQKLKKYQEKKCIGLEEHPIIAEDLGIITDEVRSVMEQQGFPGMKILLFAFNGDLEKHPYLPHNGIFNSVMYTGTHDNNTVVGWYGKEATEEEKENLEDYLGQPIEKKDVHWDFIDMAMNAVSDLCILPMQDILGLDEKSRMNIPGTVKNNWVWRLDNSLLNLDIKNRLLDITSSSGR